MGNQSSRSEKFVFDSTAINENRGDNRYGGSRGTETDFDKGIVASDYARYNKLLNNKDWTGLIAAFREKPQYASFKDTKNHRGALPLHRAILKLASLELIDVLIELYPDAVREGDENGLRPLHFACLYNFCMEKHFNALRDERDKTSWGWVLKVLIEKYPQALQEPDNDGRLPLHLAASSAKTSPKALEMLLERYPDSISRRTKLGKLPLHFAVEARAANYDAVRILLDAYPSGAGESSERKNPLHFACGEARADLRIIQALVQAYPSGVKEKSIESMLPLHLACANKQSIEVVEFLLRVFPEAAEDRDRHSRLPLHHALEKSACDEVILLLLDEAPASVRSTGYYPHLPLCLAVEKNHSAAVIRALLKAYTGGGSAGEKDMFGVLPLRRAIKARASEEAIIALLNDYPEGAQDIDEYERLALHYASGRKMSYEVILSLVEACPSAVSVPDKNGQLPLHLAIMRASRIDVVKLFLRHYPQAVIVPDNYNFLPLHHAIELDVPLELIQVLLATNKECARSLMSGDGGKLPLHFAIEMRRPLPVLQALIASYPEGCRTRELERGRLPLCWAMERALPLEVLLLLESHYPAEQCATVKDNEGRLPIHYAVENDAPKEIVLKLLEAHPTCVQDEDLPFYFYTLREGEEEFEYTGRRLDAVVHERHAAELAATYKAEDGGGDRLGRIKLYNDSSKLSNVEKEQRQDLALDQGLHASTNADHKPKSMLKKLDNHGDVERRVVPDKNSITVAWDKEYQRSRPLNKRPKKRLIHYATEDMHASPEIVAAILGLTMPISKDTGKANVHHGYGWTYLLSETQDHYVKAVDLLLDEYASNMAFVQLLCDSPDELGRLACDVATPLCLKAIMARLHYFGRYQLDPGPALHKSHNSLVRLATDHHHLFAGKDGKDSNSASKRPNQEGLPPEKLHVAVKFMRFRDQFERETQLRTSIKFSPEFVVPLLSAHDGDADPTYRRETRDKGYAEYPYLISLAAADRDLQTAIAHEHFAGRDFDAVRLIATQILRALSHLHTNGIIHGDLKPSNIVRHKNVFKLIDLGAATRLKDFAGKHKFSTGYTAPELVFKRTAGFKNKKSGPESEEEVGIGLEPVTLLSKHESHEYTLSSKTGEAVYVGNDQTGPRIEQLPAHPSIDMWSFGVILYQMSTGEHLFPVNIDDNTDPVTEKRILAPWTNEQRAQRLKKVEDHWVRNLIFQCLSKDPKRRPDAEDALQHPFFTGVARDILDAYRMPGQPCKYDVVICHRKPVSETERAFRLDKLRAQLRLEREAKKKDKSKWDLEEEGEAELEAAEDGAVEEDPKLLKREQEDDENTLEAVAELEARLVRQGLVVKKCSYDCKELLHAHSVVIVLSRGSINNKKVAHRQVLKLRPDSDFESYFYEMRVVMEMRAQSYVEGGVVALLVGDKEPPQQRRERLVKERAEALAERDQRREEERKQLVAEEKAASRKAYAEKRRSNRGARTSSKSPTRGRGGKKEEDPVKAAERIRLEKQNALQAERDKEDAEEEEAHRVAMESDDTCYLPYYAQHMGQIMGKFGGSHPFGQLCEESVDAVEQQVRAYLQRYFLGRTPILNSKLAASPQGIIHDIINCPNVMVVGEQEGAWQNATAEIQAALSKDNEEEDESVEEDDNEAELNAAIAEAMARKLKEKLQLKQNEIALIEQTAELARKEMEKAVDTLHKISLKYGIY